MRCLLFEFPAETRVTVYRQLDILVQEELPSKSIEFIYNVSLFEDVFGDIDHHDMKMCNCRSILHVLKFHFGKV